MTHDAQDIVDRAIAWHLRLDTATADEWEEFIGWLEADAAHRAVYDRIALDDALLATPQPTGAKRVANDAAEEDRRIDSRVVALHPRRARTRWFAAGGGAIAAALVATLMIPGQMTADTRYTVETPPGTTRRVALDDGTSIEMNGGTRLTLSHGDPRFAALDAGEATFHVRHDAAHPFELTSGGFTVRDLGTVFNVSRDGPALAVEVAEGAVLFQPDRQAVTLGRGMALAVRDEQARPVVRRVPASSVGGWRTGVLDFHDAPIGAVARAVARSTGARIAVDPALDDRLFTGTIHVAGTPEAVIARAAGLIGASWRQDKGGWTLLPRSDGGR